MGPQTLTFDLTLLDSADWSALSDIELTAVESGAFTWDITDELPDMDTANFGPDGSGLVLGTDGGGQATANEYAANHNGVGLDIALATLFPSIASGDTVEVATQWADDNSSSTQYQELAVQIHDNQASRDSMGLAYNHNIGVRTIKRINNGGSAQGAVQTTPASTPPTVITILMFGDNFGEGYFANTGAMAAPRADTFVARPTQSLSETGAGAMDISGCHTRVTAASHSATGWPPTLEKIRVTWWPAVTT